MDRDRGDVRGVLDESRERELARLEVHHLGRLVVDGNRGVDAVRLEAGDVRYVSLEVEHLPGVRARQLHVGVPAHPSILIEAGILERLVLQEVVRELGDLGWADHGAVLVVGDDRDVPRESHQAPVVQRVLQAVPAHEAGLLLVDHLGRVAEIQRDVGLPLVVFGLDDRREHPGRACAAEGNLVVVVADDDGLRRQQRAPDAERGPREIYHDPQVRRGMDDVEHVEAARAMEIGEPLGDRLGLALEKGGLEPGGRIVVRAQLGVHEYEPVLDLALQLVLVHVVGGPPGPVVPLVEVVQVRPDRYEQAVIVVHVPGAGLRPVVGVEDAVRLLVYRDDLVVGYLVHQDLLRQHEAQKG